MVRRLNAPRHHLPPFLAAVVHNISAPNNERGDFPGSLGGSKHRSSDGRLTQFDPARPDLGFSAPAIVPKTTRCVSRSSFVHCTPPANKSHSLRMVVRTLSHCVFLRALAYVTRWSVRYRRWKPVLRRRWWCSVRKQNMCVIKI